MPDIVSVSKSLKEKTPKLLDALKERLTYRINVGTLREMEVPRLRAMVEKQWDNGKLIATPAEAKKTLDEMNMRTKQIGEYTTKFDNATLWAKKFIGEMRSDIRELQKLLAKGPSSDDAVSAEKAIEEATKLLDVIDNDLK